MNGKQLKRMGVHDGDTRRLAMRQMAPAMRDGMNKGDLRRTIAAIIDDPASHVDDPHFAEFAKALLPADHPLSPYKPFVERGEPAPWNQWGDDLDPASVQQMRNACRLPVAVAAALMPDAHVGYGLPIGGVLATDNAVVPYAVGVDIACRMKLTVLDMPPEALDKRADQLTRAIEDETRFGIGAEFKGKRREHAVLDDDWSVSPITQRLRSKAHAQLGTSGSGNHFVEFGTLTIPKAACGLASLEPGAYLALLSHSGSRGTGAQVCDHYSRLAREQHPELPAELSHLAWLSLDTDAGREYWAAMNLMGKYAAANHALIHHHIAKHLGVTVLADVENHHNFAWRETHLIDGAEREVIVHRKGATPASDGILGVIPGSMAAPGFVVRGRGEPTSLLSASHGAGRAMSRTQAKKTYRWASVRDYLKHRHVTVISAGLDEVPFAYKDIEQVMAAQRDLVDVVARFDPRLVKMAPAGERPED